MLSYFHCFSVFNWTGENDSNTLRVDAYFFWKREQKSLFQKYLDTGGQGLNYKRWTGMQWPRARKISLQLVLCRQAEIQKFLQALKKANIRIYSFKMFQAKKRVTPEGFKIWTPLPSNQSEKFQCWLMIKINIISFKILSLKVFLVPPLTLTHWITLINFDPQRCG